MVVDDEPYGFKHMSKHVVGLESFPIYIEIEYSKGSDDDKIIDSIEIYSETTLKSDAYIDDILSLNQVYRKTILVDRIQRLNEANMSFLFSCNNFKLLEFLFTSQNIDLINELLPFPLVPHKSALFVKLPFAKFNVFLKSVFFCLSIPIRRSISIDCKFFTFFKFFVLLSQIKDLHEDIVFLIRKLLKNIINSLIDFSYYTV